MFDTVVRLCLNLVLLSLNSLLILYCPQKPNRLEFISSRNMLTSRNEVPGVDTKQKAQPDLAQASITITQAERNSPPDTVRTVFLSVTCDADNMLAVQRSEGVSTEKSAEPLDTNGEEDTLTVCATSFF